MQNLTAIMHRHIAVEPNRAGGRIDLDPAEIENEAVAQRTVHLVGFGRRGELGRSPENGFADGLIEAGGNRAWGPMAGGGQAHKRNRVVDIAARGDAAVGKHDLPQRHIELRCRQTGEPIAQIDRGKPRGTRYGRREPA